MREMAVLCGALALAAGACGGGREERPRPAPERAQRHDCGASFTPSRQLLSGRRRLRAGPVELLVPRAPRPAAAVGGMKLPVLVHPGGGSVSLRLTAPRAAAFTRGANPFPPGDAGPVPAEAVAVVRLAECPPMPREAQEIPGLRAVAYATLLAVARDACVPLTVTPARGRPVRVRLPVGRACA